MRVAAYPGGWDSGYEGIYTGVGLSADCKKYGETAAAADISADGSICGKLRRSVTRSRGRRRLAVVVVGAAPAVASLWAPRR